MPWLAEERAELEQAKLACVGKEALVIAGRMKTVVRLQEMHIEENGWWAILVDSPDRGSPPCKIEFDSDFEQSVSPDYWHFPYLSERYFFDDKLIKEYRENPDAFCG